MRNIISCAGHTSVTVAITMCPYFFSQVYGSIEIGVHTKCIVTKRKSNSYPFMVCALHGRHLFKVLYLGDEGGVSGVW